MRTFLGTTLGKILIGILAAAVVGGGGYGAYRAGQQSQIAANADANITTAVATEKITTTEKPATEESIIEEITETPTTATKTTAATTTTTTKVTTTMTTTTTEAPTKSAYDALSGLEPLDRLWQRILDGWEKGK